MEFGHKLLRIASRGSIINGTVLFQRYIYSVALDWKTDNTDNVTSFGTKKNEIVSALKRQYYSATRGVRAVFAVDRCPSVRPSVCLTRSCIVSR